jgi:hypothetical protein
MDKYGSIDQNWYSSENQKHEMEKATEALKQMKELEKQYEKSRTVIIERTQYKGVRKRYLKTKS